MRTRAIHGRLRLLLMAAVFIFGAFTRTAVHAEGLTRSLEPQPLVEALEAFARQTGMQVIYAPDIARGIQSPGASAGRSTQDTLRELLRNTNLTFRYVNERTVTILRIAHEVRAPVTKAAPP